MLRRIKHMRTKVIAVMFLLIAFLLIIVWCAISIYVNNTFGKQILSDKMSLLEKFETQIENDLVFIEKYVSNVAYSNDLQNLLREYYRVSSDEVFKYYSSVVDVEKLLANRTILNNEMIFNMYIIDEENEKTIRLAENYKDILQAEWYINSVNNNILPSFSSPYVDSEEITGLEVISYLTRFNDINNPEKPLGIMVANLDYKNIFSQIFSEVNGDETYYILNIDENILYSINVDTDVYSSYKYGDYIKETIIKGANYYYLSMPIEKLDSVLVTAIPVSLFKENLNSLLNIVYVIFALGLVGGLILIVPLSNSLTKPIIKLTNAIDKVAKGDFDNQIVIKQQDELLALTNSYNYMIKEIKRLLEEMELKNQKEKDMQIKLFMNKINPHFIYNTLNSVIYLARRKKSIEIVNLTKSFIDILRRNIVTSDRNVKIYDEIEHLKNYIEVLKYQYNDIINIDFNIENDAGNYEIPPMILYPLVENSIFHGIVPKSKPGKINVTIKEKEDKIIFSISDNGVGISKHQLEAINEYLTDERRENQNSHIGLKSVYERLVFFYGKDVVFNIDSEVDAGTTIYFEITKSSF